MKTIDINALETLYAICAVKPDKYFNPITELKNRAERYNNIIGALSSTTRPLRCKEIAESLPKVTRWFCGEKEEYTLPWQAVSALLKIMRRDGTVERIQIGTETIRDHIQVPIYGYRLAEVEG